VCLHSFDINKVAQSSAQSEVWQLTDNEDADDDHERQGDVGQGGVGRTPAPLSTMTRRRLSQSSIGRLESLPGHLQCTDEPRVEHDKRG